ncbi:helix-turn-helix domain-containing protein [Kitasatospora sp. GP82]|uniref:helix-turn-helix domain-containing protein n=1 Tax=Kitasatospora sp. GP82 TaxID=3035089 RepID=UPI00247428E3|nr:helix-turn-helix domain-containing protein [Kitasatospora sp. GP82]MDH6130364.1 transcriptional regulator with XRE-family HTH domain [Kitasatospora sp. GP82]
MSTSVEAMLRTTVAALMHHTGESQEALAAGLRISQAQVSRKQSGRSAWAIADLEKLAAHYGMHPPDLLMGPTHAIRQLPAVRLAAVVGGRQSVLSV